MKHHIDIIDGIKDIFIEMVECTVSNEAIYLITNKYKTLLNKMDEAYCCIKTSIIDDNLIAINSNLHSKKYIFVERIKIINYTIYSFIGRSHSESNKFYRRWYS